MTGFVLSILASVVVTAARSEAAGDSVVCDGEYVLCTSAPCIPDPTDPEKKTICQCNVHAGRSFGHTSCDSRRPRTLAQGGKALISTYSFEQASSMQLMTCAAGFAWSDCLDQPCVVDPLDEKRAICTCKLVPASEYVTYGGSCDTGSCGLGYWSGATPSSYEAASKYLAKELGLSANPVQACPTK